MTTCASSDTSGSSGLQNIAYSTANFVNVTAGSEDLHLTSGSALKNVGTQLLSTFQDDIDGNFRGGAWDIGAHEYGATTTREVIRYVDPDSAGGNGQIQTLSGTYAAYVSANSAEAALQQDLTAINATLRIICSSNLDAGSGSADTTGGIYIAGWTTSASCRLKWESNSNHGGKWNANIYRHEYIGNGSRNFRVQEDFVDFIGLQMSSQMEFSNFCEPIYVDNTGTTSSNNAYYRRLILKGLNSDWGSGIAIFGSGTHHVENCVIYDFTSTSGGYGVYINNSIGTVYVYNCTVDNVYTRGVHLAAGTAYATNVGVSNSGAGFSVGVTQTTCSTSTPTFVDESGDDFHLENGDRTWRTGGTDLSGTFTDDIDGDTRTFWGIGADAGTSGAVVIRYVDPDSSAGGTGRVKTLSGTDRAYVSLNAWEAARQGDLTTYDVVEKAICSSNLDAGSGTADTTRCLIDGWTLGASNYITIEANSNDGKWNDNYYRLVGADGSGQLAFRDTFIRVIGIQFDYAETTGNQNCVDITSVAGGQFYFNRCIFRNSAGQITTGTWCILLDVYNPGTDADVYIRNSLFYGITHSSPGTTNGVAIVSYGASADVYVDNCTIVSCSRGLSATTSGVMTTRNSYVGNCETEYVGLGTHNRTTCMHSSGTSYSGSTGSIAYSTANFTNVTVGSEDLHLTSGSALRGVGTDLSAYFTDDIDGDDRPTVYSDDFADGLGDWTDITGQSSNSLVQGAGETATGEAGASSNHGRFNQVLSDNHVSWITYSTMASPYACGPLLRVQDDAFTYYYVSVVNTTTLRIRSIIDSAGATIGSDITGFGTLSNGSRIKGMVVGSVTPTIYAFVDLGSGWVLAGSRTDSASRGPLTGSYAGARVFDDDTNFIDDFGCTECWDIGADQYVAGGATTYTRTANLDALLKKVLSQSASFDAYLQKSFSADFDVDALLAKAQAKVADIDSLLNKIGMTKDADIDALLAQAGQMIAATVDALLVLSPTLSAEVDALLGATLTRALAIDAYLKVAGSKPADVDALLSKGQSKMSSVDAVLIGEVAKTLSVDALLNQVGLTKTASVDAILYVLGETTIEAHVDSLLSKVGMTREASVDSLLAKVGLSSAASVDSVLSKLMERTTSLDAILSAAGLEKSLAVDALLVESGLVSTVAIDSLLSTSFSAQASVDALLAKMFTHSVAADALLSKTQAKTAAIDAILFAGAAYAVLVGIDAVLTMEAEMWVGIDAILFQKLRHVVLTTHDVYKATPKRVMRDVGKTLSSPLSDKPIGGNGRRDKPLS